MGETRLTNLCYGKYANFYARTDNTLDQGSATPNVSNGVLFYSINTGATVITNLAIDATSQVPGSAEGKIVEIIFLDTATKLRKSTALKVADDTTNFGTGDSIRLIYHGSAWYEMSRSTNRTANPITKTLASGNTYNLVVNQDTLNYVLATTNLGLTVRSVSGGYLGQVINIMCASVGTGVVYVMSDGNIAMSTAQVIIAPTNGALRLVCCSSTPVLWSAIGGNVGL